MGGRKVNRVITKNKRSKLYSILSVIVLIAQCFLFLFTLRKLYKLASSEGFHQLMAIIWQLPQKLLTSLVQITKSNGKG